MKGRIEAALATPACERLREFYAVGPVQRAAVESFADVLAERALITRAVVLLLDWQVKYGTQRPQWLPPAGDVRWLEDATAYLNATALPASGEPGCPESGKHCNVVSNECQTCGTVGVKTCEGGKTNG